MAGAPPSPRWSWPLAYAAALAASAPLLAHLPVLAGRNAIVVGDATSHAVVANALVTDGLPHGWVDVYNGGFPFGIHYQSVGYLLVASLIRLGLPPGQSIQLVGVAALVALPLCVVWSAHRLRQHPGLAVVAAWMVAWISPISGFVGGWEEYLFLGLLAQALGLVVSVAFTTTVLREGATWPALPLGALLSATHPQIATGTLTLLALAFPFARGTWRRRFVAGATAAGVWLAAVFGHGVVSLGIPFGFPPSMTAWKQLGFAPERAPDLLSGDLFDHWRLPVTSSLWLFATCWLVAFASRPAARALLAAGIGGFALSVSGAAMLSLGPIGAVIGAFVMPLRLMALLPLVAGASVVVAGTELTRGDMPRWARPLLAASLGTALALLGLPERWRWAGVFVRTRVSHGELGEAGLVAGAAKASRTWSESDASARVSTSLLKRWLAELDRGRVSYDLDQPGSGWVGLHGVELHARVARGHSLGAVTHLGTLVEAFASLHPSRPGSGARAEALGVRHVYFLGGTSLPPTEPFREVRRHGPLGLATRVGGTDTVGVGCVVEEWSGSDRPLREAIVTALAARPGLLDEPSRLVALAPTRGDLTRREVDTAGCDVAGASVAERTREPGAYEATVLAPNPVDVVIRATAYSRWRVAVDGVLTPWRMVAPGFFAVRVPAGEHHVEAVVSLPPTYPAGLVAAALGTALASVALARRERRSPPRALP